MLLSELSRRKPRKVGALLLNVGDYMYAICPNCGKEISYHLIIDMEHIIICTTEGASQTERIGEQDDDVRVGA